MTSSEREGVRAGYPHLVKPPGAAGVRKIVVATRLTDPEAADLDFARGHLSRADYLRLLLMRDRKHRAEQ